MVEAVAGGLPRARVSGARADAELYLQGGHLTRWQPHGAAPVLFLSQRAAYAPGKAIRGGVPVILPTLASDGFQPDPDIAKGEKPGQWLVAFRDYESARFEAFGLRTECQ